MGIAIKAKNMIKTKFKILFKHKPLFSCLHWVLCQYILIRHGILALYLDFIQTKPVAEKSAIELIPNEISQIIRFEDMTIAGKLMTMGILPHAEIELVRRNALGRTLIFRINSRFKIALRRDEARHIIIKGA